MRRQKAISNLGSETYVVMWAQLYR